MVCANRSAKSSGVSEPMRYSRKASKKPRSMPGSSASASYWSRTTSRSRRVRLASSTARDSAVNVLGRAKSRKRSSRAASSSGRSTGGGVCNWLSTRGRAARTVCSRTPLRYRRNSRKLVSSQIRKGRPVAPQLLRVFNVIQPFLGRPLGLDVADDAVRSIPQPEIRVAALGRLGQGGDVHVRPAAVVGHRLEHRGQGRVETLLAGVALPRGGGEVLEVAGKDGFWVHPASPFPLTLPSPTRRAMQIRAPQRQVPSPLRGGGLGWVGGGLPQAVAMRCNRSDGSKHAVGRPTACLPLTPALSHQGRGRNHSLHGS